LYYQPKPIDNLTFDLLNKVDEIYTDCPFFGSRKITAQLKKEGYPVNRKRIRRLMRILDIQAVYPKPRLSCPNKQHLIYPYLLKNLIIDKPNQVWGIDITYIRLKNTWLYLAAILDWFSRLVLAWELSDTLETGFCCRTLKKALTIGIPDIHNSDQGSQTTASRYLNILKAYPGIKISMDGRGRAFDNIFIERLWRTIKYEEVYLKDYSSPKEARQNLNDYLEFYNYRRPHQSLGYQTPAEVYFKN